MERRRDASTTELTELAGSTTGQNYDAQTGTTGPAGELPMCGRMYRTGSRATDTENNNRGIPEYQDEFSMGYPCGRSGSRDVLCQRLNKWNISPNYMSSSEELARLHIDTAVKLMGKEFVVQHLATVATPAPAPAAASSGRGRKPGAAPAESRCAWNAGQESHCKNKRFESNSYCKIHVGKIHLVDPSTTSTTA